MHPSRPIDPPLVDDKNLVVCLKITRKISIIFLKLFSSVNNIFNLSANILSISSEFLCSLYFKLISYPHNLVYSLLYTKIVLTMT